MAEDTAHRDDLAFVMESVSQDVMEDERGRTDRDVSIGKMQLRGGIEILLAKARQIIQCSHADFALEASGVGDGGPIGRGLVNKRDRLERVDPKPLAVEDMNHLRMDGGKAKAGNFFCVRIVGNCGEVVEQRSEARMGPFVEFADTGDREHSNSPLMEIERIHARHAWRDCRRTVPFGVNADALLGCWPLADLNHVSITKRYLIAD